MGEIILKEKIAVRHYSCDKCRRQIYPGEKIIIERDEKLIIFNIYCFQCGEKIKKQDDKVL